MKIRLLNIVITFSQLFFIFSCGKSNSEENKELNFMISSIVKTENKNNRSVIYIDDSLKQLKVYVPSQEEIDQKLLPPPGKKRSILRLLDFKQNYSKEDSLKILKQDNYALKTIQIDKKINSDLEIKNSINQEQIYLSFSAPIYFTNDFVYIEVGYYDHFFSRGAAYLLKKENGTWKVIRTDSLWIS